MEKTPIHEKPAGITFPPEPILPANFSRNQTDQNMSKEQIQEAVRKSLQDYFDILDGQKPTNVYNMIMHTVEKPILVAVMAHARNNQSLAAEILGINRNTLRKKLLEHELL